MKKLTTLLLATIALSGCGQAVSPVLSRSATPQMVSTLSVPKTKAEFVAAVSALGVKLTEAQIAEIAANRIAKPNGQWAPRPAVNLTAQQNLDVHFKKHGMEFHPQFEDAQGYMEGAIALAEGKRGSVQYYFDSTSFKKGYQSKVVIWNSSTRELTALRPDGAMTTFYHDNKLAPNRFVIVPIF